MNDHDQSTEDLTGNNPQAIAQTILDGFNKHYHIFREFSDEAMDCFERADWARVGTSGKERILGYEARVKEAVKNLNQRFPDRLNRACLSLGSPSQTLPTGPIPEPVSMKEKELLKISGRWLASIPRQSTW